MNNLVSQNVYTQVKLIPPGKVATYKYIALKSGLKNPRFVGRILHRNPDPTRIPCHRVVNFRGELAVNFAFGGREGQKQKLEREDVIVIGYRVDLSEYSASDQK